MFEYILLALVLLLAVFYAARHFIRLLSQGEEPPVCQKCQLKELQKIQQNRVGFAGRGILTSPKKR